MSCCTGAVPLLLHLLVKSFCINCEAFFFSIFARQFQREAVCVIQFEGVLAIYGRFALFVHLFKDAVQDVHPFVDRFLETLLFICDDFDDEILVRFYFWIIGFHNICHNRNQFVQEQFFDAQFLPMHDRAADQTTQNVATAFIGRQGTVPDRKTDGADMIGDDFERDIQCFVFAVLLAVAQRLDFFYDWHEQIRFKVGWCVLDYARDALQTHPRIDVLVR